MVRSMGARTQRPTNIPPHKTRKGFHSDLNETYPVGRIDDDSLRLIRTTRKCLDEAIKICKPGALFRDIGKTMCVSPPVSPARAGYANAPSSVSQRADRAPERVLGRAHVLRARHERPLPLCAEHPALREEQGRRDDEARPDLHHRARALPRATVSSVRG